MSELIGHTVIAEALEIGPPEHFNTYTILLLSDMHLYKTRNRHLLKPRFASLSANT